jgi:hypothetical protein
MTGWDVSPVETPEAQPSRPARKPRWLAALTASVVLHGLLGAALWRGWPSPVPSRPAPIEFTLVHLPPVQAPAAGQPSAGQTAPVTGPAGTPAALQRAPGPAVAAIPSVPDVEADVEAVEAGAPPGDHPDLAWATPGAPPTGPPPDLTGRPPAEVVAFYAPPHPTPEERIHRLLREDLGRERVRSGLADPFFLDFGRSVLEAWAPEKVVTDRGLSGYVKNLGRSLADFAAVYAEQAARYGRTGSPFAPGEAPLGIASLAPVPEGITTQIADQMAVVRAMAGQSRARHAALLRVVQRADGRLVSVELVRPSDDSSVDAQALRDLRDSAATLPAPTPSALAGRTHVASTWEFSLVVSISPPLPMIAVQFDEVLGLADVRVPLDRRLFKLVRLVSVD